MPAVVTLLTVVAWDETAESGRASPVHVGSEESRPPQVSHFVGIRSRRGALHEPSCQGVVELFVDGGEEVAVGAEGDVDRRVAHALHDRPGVGALGDQERCVGVAQVVVMPTSA